MKVSLRILGLLDLSAHSGTLGEGLQSISTDRTRAPSFASKAAKGRPTTSDLSNQYDRYISSYVRNVPVDNGDNLSSSPITVIQHLVVDA
jgi:hypothetical protein